MQIVNEFTLEIDQIESYQFRVRYDKEHYPDLMFDEPAPLGRDTAPSPSRVLAAAIGDCLAASLLFCARKAKVELGPIHARVTMKIARNERGRLRVAGVEVHIDPGIADEEKKKALRCLDIFEDYCIVTQSVRDGIDVQVHVAGMNE